MGFALIRRAVLPHVIREMQVPPSQNRILFPRVDLKPAPSVFAVKHFCCCVFVPCLFWLQPFHALQKEFGAWQVALQPDGTMSYSKA
jgi:hypothetical protein